MIIGIIIGLVVGGAAVYVLTRKRPSAPVTPPPDKPKDKHPDLGAVERQGD
jgi:hypothetical protein